MTRATKPTQMACLTIAHMDFLLPADKAMKVAELMTAAFSIREDFDRESSHRVYMVSDRQPEVEFKLVRQNQLRFPPGTATPEKRLPARLPL